MNKELMWVIVIILGVVSADLAAILPTKTDYSLSPVTNMYVVNEGTYRHATKTEVRENLEKKLKEHSREWSKGTKTWMVNTLWAGEQEFSIDHKIILNLISIESQYSFSQTGHNKNQTKDYGIIQINDVNMDEFCEATKVLDKYKIWYTSTSNKHDPALGIMGAYIYLHKNRNALLIRNEFSEERWIISYNCGLAGSNEKDPKYNYLDEKRKRYWEKYCTADTFVGW